MLGEAALGDATACGEAGLERSLPAETPGAASSFGSKFGMGVVDFCNFTLASKSLENSRLLRQSSKCCGAGRIAASIKVHCVSPWPGIGCFPGKSAM